MTFSREQGAAQRINSARPFSTQPPRMRRKSALLHNRFHLRQKSPSRKRAGRWPPSCFSIRLGRRSEHSREERIERMRKSALFLLMFLLSSTPLFAQMQDRGGSGDFGGGQPGTPDLSQPGTPSPHPPDFGGQGGSTPCPPGSTAPDLNRGDRGGLGQDQDRAVPNDRNPQTPGNLPPNSPGSVPSTPQGSIPQSPQGSVPNTPSDQGGLNQPGSGDQFGMTDCPPNSTDRGGLNQGGGLDNRSGQDLPGSDRQTPPPLLPPAGGAQ